MEVQAIMVGTTFTEQLLLQRVRQVLSEKGYNNFFQAVGNEKTSLRLFYFKFPYLCPMLSQENFNENLQALIGEEKSPSFLLAVSGGVDSMVLLYLISNFKSQISNSFVVAHINYKLRGKDSDLDQKLVEEFCENHQIKLHIYQVSEKDQKPENASIQLWARELRYRFFREIQERENLKYLITAHHLNDQLETFFINLSRGSGITGLSGIPTNENQILRPLLPFSKEEIYAFAKENDIPFREDISNAKNDYLRNKIRNTIIPHFLDLTPHLSTISRKASIF